MRGTTERGSTHNREIVADRFVNYSPVLLKCAFVNDLCITVEYVTHLLSGYFRKNTIRRKRHRSTSWSTQRSQLMEHL